LEKYCDEIASYKRPTLYLFVDKIEINNVGKTNYLLLQKIASEEVEKLKKIGKWD
jgi:acyl-CoA synthetase (AMP-forming)/AMP-acid ligase II